MQFRLAVSSVQPGNRPFQPRAGGPVSSEQDGLGYVAAASVFRRALAATNGKIGAAIHRYITPCIRPLLDPSLASQS